MTICISLENVLSDFLPKALELYNKQAGKSISLDSIASLDLYDCMTHEDADGLTKLLKGKSIWDNLTPLVGAKEGLRKLVDGGNKVYIITNSVPEGFMWRTQWIKKHFPFFNLDNVVRATDCSLLECDALITDDLVQLARNTLAHRIRLAYPWSEAENWDYVYDIEKCENWKEVVKAVERSRMV